MIVCRLCDIIGAMKLFTEILHVRIDTKTKRALERRAKNGGMKVAVLLRQVVREYLTKPTK